MDCSSARTKNPSEWLQTCPDFSQPLAEQVTDWILNWEPDLTESIKWNMLCFTGRKLVCGLSACKHHLGITLFRGTELPDPSKLLQPAENNTSILSIRLTTLDGFNREAFRKLLRAAVTLDEDPTAPPPPKVKREPWPVPDFFKKALAEKRNRVAAENFQKMSPSCQREYLVWLSTAKRDETREKRLQATLAALACGRKWIDRKQAAPGK